MSVFERARDRCLRTSGDRLTKTEFRKLVKMQRSIYEQRDCSQRQVLLYSGIRV